MMQDQKSKVKAQPVTKGKSHAGTSGKSGAVTITLRARPISKDNKEDKNKG